MMKSGAKSNSTLFSALLADYNNLLCSGYTLCWNWTGMKLAAVWIYRMFYKLNTYACPILLPACQYFKPYFMFPFDTV